MNRPFFAMHGLNADRKRLPWALSSASCCPRASGGARGADSGGTSRIPESENLELGGRYNLDFWKGSGWPKTMEFWNSGSTMHLDNDKSLM